MTVSFIRPLRIDGEVAYVQLTRGYEAIIDAADADLVSMWNWSVMRTGVDLKYAKRNRLVGDGDGPKAILLHRVICNPPLGFGVDHINGNGLDNRRSNLRVASQAQNCRNTRLRARNTSGYKGVFWDKFTSRWMAAIGCNGKFHNLGRFKTREEAAAAYAAAATDLFGKFARLK